MEMTTIEIGSDELEVIRDSLDHYTVVLATVGKTDGLDEKVISEKRAQIDLLRRRVWKLLDNLKK